MIRVALRVSLSQEFDFPVGCSPVRKGNNGETSDMGADLDANIPSYTTVLICRLLIIWLNKIVAYLSGNLVVYHLPAPGQPAWGWNDKLLLPSTIILKLFHKTFFPPLQRGRAVLTLWEKRTQRYTLQLMLDCTMRQNPKESSGNPHEHCDKDLFPIDTSSSIHPRILKKILVRNGEGKNQDTQRFICRTRSVKRTVEFLHPL